jgi:FkbM family methyltransferase
MQHFTPGASQLHLADGTSINVATYRLPSFDWGDFQLVVDGDASDAISQALHQQNFRPPPGFRILEDWGQLGRRILDLGAHIGTFALLAAALGCQVAAVEADPINCALLQASGQCNGFANPQVIAAISDRTAMLDFAPAGQRGRRADAQNELPTIQLAATTVDALLAQLGWTQVDLIRMNSAGAEVQAVAGMAQLLQRADAPPILFAADGKALAGFGETPQRLLAALEGYGYGCYRVEPAAWRLTPASTPQWACVTDYLALKATPPPPHWRFLPPLTQPEMVQEIQTQARRADEHCRAYVGALLAQAEPAILHERPVIRTLQALQADPHPAVRAAVTWWKLQDMPLAVRMADRITRLRTKKP